MSLSFGKFMPLATADHNHPQDTVLGQHRSGCGGYNTFLLHGPGSEERILADIDANVGFFGLENNARNIETVGFDRRQAGQEFRGVQTAGGAHHHMFSIRIKDANKAHLKAQDFQRLV